MGVNGRGRGRTVLYPPLVQMNAFLCLCAGISDPTSPPPVWLVTVGWTIPCAARCINCTSPSSPPTDQNGGLHMS